MYVQVQIVHVRVNFPFLLISTFHRRIFSFKAQKIILKAFHFRSYAKRFSSYLICTYIHSMLDISVRYFNLGTWLVYCVFFIDLICLLAFNSKVSLSFLSRSLFSRRFRDNRLFNVVVDDSDTVFLCSSFYRRFAYETSPNIIQYMYVCMFVHRYTWIFLNLIFRLLLLPFVSPRAREASLPVNFSHHELSFCSKASQFASTGTSLRP